MKTTINKDDLPQLFKESLAQLKRNPKREKQIIDSIDKIEQFIHLKMEEHEITPAELLVITRTIYIELCELICKTDPTKWYRGN